jgi:HAD superfamily hydrolase (TIGR01484 family)
MANESRLEGVTILATDVDGTLLARGHVLAFEEAHALAALVKRGWNFAAITGQNVFDIEKRVITPLGAVGVDSCSIYTCEGARRWLFRAGQLIQDRTYGREYIFQETDREELESATSKFVLRWRTLGHGQVDLAGWWEEAIFVLKFRNPNAVDRGAITRALRLFLGNRVRPELMDMIDIRIAGRTTVILARRTVNKATALKDLLNRWHRPKLLYIGDEFGPSGNDAPAIGLPGLQLVSVGEIPTTPRNAVKWIGAGPQATLRFIRELASAGPAPYS